MFDHIWFYVSFAHWFISTYLLHFNETQPATWSYFDLVCWNIASPTSGLNPCTSPALRSPSINLSRKGDVTDPTSSNFNSRIAHWDLGLIFPSSSLFSSDPCRQGLKQVTDLKYKPHDRISRVERNMTQVSNMSNGVNLCQCIVFRQNRCQRLVGCLCPLFQLCAMQILNWKHGQSEDVWSSLQFYPISTFPHFLRRLRDPCTMTSSTSGPGRYKKLIRRLNPCKPFN